MTRGPGRLTITPLPAKEAREVERKAWAVIAAGGRHPALDLFVRAYAASKARRPGRPKGRPMPRTVEIQSLFAALRRMGATRSEAVGIVADAASIDLSTAYKHCT